MPNPRDLILLQAVTATGTGPGQGLGGQAIRYAGGAGNNRNTYPLVSKVRVTMSDSATGATGVVAIQTAPDGATWTTQFTVTLGITATTGLKVTQARLLKTASGSLYIRANVTSLSGGSAPTINAYLTSGEYGI